MCAIRYNKHVVKFASDEAPSLNQYAITTLEGKRLHVYDANIIRLLSEGLRVHYDVTMPSDGAFGKRLPGGNWTGMIGMIQRSEAHIAVNSVAMTEERYRDVSFSFPHIITEVTFMTDKSTFLRSSSVLSPFSYTVWFALLVFTIPVSILFFALANKKKTYQSILLGAFGSILEKPIGIQAKTFRLKLLTLSWIFGVMIISQSYKAVLLSFMSVPLKIGIRDILDLSRAAAEDSVKCYTYRGGYLLTMFSKMDDNSLTAIGECLRRNQDFPGDAEGMFLQENSRKSFICGKMFLAQYDREYFISEDSISTELHAFPYSKEFCCPKRLDRLVHRLFEAGVFDKILKDENFVSQLLRMTKSESKSSDEPDIAHVISFHDVSEAFKILISGWILSLVVLLAELRLKKIISLLEG